jgi:hypothetical protein
MTLCPHCLKPVRDHEWIDLLIHMQIGAKP